MELEEAIRIMEEWSNSYYKEVVENDDSFVIEIVLQELERYKRLAEANLKDSEEFQNNMCEHRCILKLEIQELQENSIPKKKIEDKIKEYMEYDKKVKTYTSDGRENFTMEYFYAKNLQELLEDK